MMAKKVEVHPYPGQGPESCPRKFDLDGETVEVVETFENWVREGTGKGDRKHCYKVKGSDEQIYTLCFDEKKNDWFYEPA